MPQQLYSQGESTAATKHMAKSRWLFRKGVSLPTLEQVARASRFDLVFWYRYLTIPKNRAVESLAGTVRWIGPREFFEIIGLVIERLYETNPQNKPFQNMRAA